MNNSALHLPSMEPLELLQYAVETLPPNTSETIAQVLEALRSSLQKHQRSTALLEKQVRRLRMENATLLKEKAQQSHSYAWRDSSEPSKSEADLSQPPSDQGRDITLIPETLRENMYSYDGAPMEEQESLAQKETLSSPVRVRSPEDQHTDNSSHSVARTGPRPKNITDEIKYRLQKLATELSCRNEEMKCIWQSAVQKTEMYRSRIQRLKRELLELPLLRKHSSAVEMELEALKKDMKRLETVALEYVPLEHDEVLEDIYAWKEEFLRVGKRQKQRRVKENRRQSGASDVGDIT